MNPLSFLAPYKLLFEILLIGALAGGVMYGVHQLLEHERDIGRNEVRAEYAVKLAEVKDAAHRRETELITQRDEAVKNANDREQTIRTVAAGGAAASIGLRDTIASIRDSVSSATNEALGKSVVSLSTVLTDCQGRYRALAERADRHANDARTLDEAWPK